MSLLDVLAKITLDSSGYEKGLNKAKKSSNEYKRDVMNLAQTYKQQGMSMSDAMKRAYSEIDKSQYDMSKNSKTTTNQIGLNWANVGEKVKVVAEKIGAAVKVGMKVAGGAAVAFGASSIKTGMDFDSAMSQVAATMGKTTDDVKELRVFAQKMGETTKFSATEAAEALNYMALAGYDDKKAMATLPKVLNLAAAGNIDLASASDMVTDAQSALGLNMKQTNEMVNQMARTSSKSNTSVAQLGEAILTVGATARSIKGGTTEISTILGVLADNGIKGAEGGTHLRNMLLSLQTPTNAGTAALKELGMTYDDMYDSSGKLRSMPEIFVELQSKMKGMSQQSKDAIVSGIFNKYDLSAANALLGTSKGRFDELTQSIKNSKGAAKEMAETQLDNLAGDVTILKSSFEGLQIAVSDKLSPALRKFTQAATTGISDITKAVKTGNFTKAFEDIGNGISKAFSNIGRVGGEILDKIVEGIRKNATKIGTVAMDIAVKFSENLRSGAGKLVDAGLKLIMSLADGLIKNIPTLIKTVPTIISNLAGIINDNAPKLIVAGATLIVKLAKGIIDSIPTLIKEFPKIIKAVVDVWTAVNWVSLGTNLITGIVNGVKNLTTTIPNAVKDIATKAVEGFKSINWAAAGTAVITTLKTAVSGAANLVVNALKTIGTNSINAFKGVNWANVGKAAINFIKTAASTAGSAIVNLLKTIGTKAIAAFKGVNWAEVGKAAVNFIKNAVSNAGSNIVNALKNVGNNAINAFRSIDWAAVGKDAINFIKNSITGTGNVIINALKIIGRDGINAFKSVDWAAVGRTVINLIANSIRGVFDTVKNALIYVANQAKSAFTNIDWGSIGTNIVRGIAGGITSGLSTIANAARDAANKALNTAKSVLGVNSPSTEFAWIGKMVDEGLALGINRNSDRVDTAVEKLSNITNFPTASDWGTATATATVPSSAIGNNTTTITMNIYGAQGQDVKALADEVERRLNNKVTRGGIAFA